MLEIAGMVVYTSKVRKTKDHLPFANNSICFVLKIELLLIVLSNYERQAALKVSTF